MGEKRKAPARSRQEPPKKRASTPPAEPSPTNSISEGLPIRLNDATPIPTLGEQQRDDLSSKEYQSIAESGILAASLQRSRHKWLSEGIFERYWTKPSKKRSQAEARPNPSKDNMTRVGPCTITIEPHVFETTLYTVKEPQTQIPTSKLGQSLQRPILQYGPPPPQQVPTATGKVSTSPQLPQSQAQPPLNGPLPSTNQNMVNGSGVTGPQTQQRPLQDQQAIISPNGPTPQEPSALQNGNVLGPTQQQAPKPSPDPVIQMLATKAATDHELKALMRVVASGKATHPQLKIFQNHIDELTAILQSENNAKKPECLLSTANHPSSSAGAASTHNAAQTGQFPPSVPTPAPSKPQIATPPSITHLNSTTRSTTTKAELLPQTYGAPPPALRSKGPPPIAKQDISAVVFEFNSGSGDRFLFPKYSILEYLTGSTQVIVSFLVVRKGSASESGTYDPELDYYQPITMRLAAQHSKILEPLAKVVATRVEARLYMDDIMDNMTRAEYVHLAMRLPRDHDDLEEDEEGEEESEYRDQENESQAVHSPPSSVGRPKKKGTKKASFAADDSSTEPEASPGPKRGKSNRTRQGQAELNKSCHICHTGITSLWRKATIDGENVSVCNACGIKWKTNSTRQEGSLKKTRMPHKAKPLVAAKTSSLSFPPPPGSFSAADENTPKSTDVEMRDVA